MTKTITVAVKGDRGIEPDERFIVTLASPVHAIIGKGQGVGTILNDENRITVSDMRVTEPRSGSTVARFIVRLSARRPSR